MGKLKQWACLVGLEGLAAFNGGAVCGLVKEQLDYPDQIVRVREFLENHLDKLQYVFERTGTNNIQDAATMLYGERMSTFCGMLSETCRNIDLPVEFASISPSGAVLGASVMAGFLWYKTRKWNKQIEKAKMQKNNVENERKM